MKNLSKYFLIPKTNLLVICSSFSSATILNRVSTPFVNMSKICWNETYCCLQYTSSTLWQCLNNPRKTVFCENKFRYIYVIHTTGGLSRQLTLHLTCQRSIRVHLSLHLPTFIHIKTYEQQIWDTCLHL